MSNGATQRSRRRVAALSVGLGITAVLASLAIATLRCAYGGVDEASRAIHAQVTSGSQWSIDTVTRECGLRAHEGAWVCPDGWVFWSLPIRTRPEAWPTPRSSSPDHLEAQYLLTRPFLGHDLEYLFVGVDPETNTVFTATASDFYRGWMGLEAMLCLAVVVGSVAALVWLSAGRRWGG